MSMTKIIQRSLILASAALVCMVAITILDVFMKTAFNRPIRATYDIVITSFVVVVVFSLPHVFRHGSNIVVDIIDLALSQHSVRRFKFFSGLLSFLFLLLLFYAALWPALDSVSYVEVMMDSGIPTYVLWTMVLVGIALSIAAAGRYVFKSFDGNA
jgi:TRAP-type C4-dicarboxylate transport system permease small subunit